MKLPGAFPQPQFPDPGNDSGPSAFAGSRFHSPAQLETWHRRPWTRGRDDPQHLTETRAPPTCSRTFCPAFHHAVALLSMCAKGRGLTLCSRASCSPVGASPVSLGTCPPAITQHLISFNSHGVSPFQPARGHLINHIPATAGSGEGKVLFFLQGASLQGRSRTSARGEEK